VKRLASALLTCVLVTLGVLAAPADRAVAHPLGDFSVNQYEGLTLRLDRVEVTAVVDTAEVPTMQERTRVDANDDGMVDEAERAAYAVTSCRGLARDFEVTAGRDRLAWAVAAPSFAYTQGAGGLPTSRLTCMLTAPARLRAATTVTVANGWRTDRVGWREMTAVGDGVLLVDSQLPSRSVSDQLSSYPADPLSASPDVRSAALRVRPAATGPAGGGGAARPSAATTTATTGGDAVTRWLAAADRRLERVAAGRRLTPVVGILAVLVAVLLGAAHAALPGHGKTVLAAYLAGRQGRVRDALAVGATVTLTHTGAVLLIGALLSTSSALAGDRLIGYLGLASGVLVTAVGVGMLVNALHLNALRGGERGSHHTTHHSHDHHTPDHGGHEQHGHEQHGHEQHGHEQHGHEQHGHDHGGVDRPGRLGLAGIGLAGGLVPSPSALVVLLGAIGLGRPGFGVLLVLGYGLGMASALTGAGLLLLLVQRRFVAGRFVAGRFVAAPFLTAGLVVIVGIGLAARAATGMF
jgi:ABC-type nickel/cobalt efflux system permease component RcnA